MMKDRGQTVAEYIIIVGIIVVAIYAMGPSIKRGYQSTIKATADQLSTQQASEQDFNENSSHLETSVTNTNSNSQRLVRERLYTMDTQVNDASETTTNSITNLGFNPQQ